MRSKSSRPIGPILDAIAAGLAELEEMRATHPNQLRWDKALVIHRHIREAGLKVVRQATLPGEVES